MSNELRSALTKLKGEPKLHSCRVKSFVPVADSTPRPFETLREEALSYAKEGTTNVTRLGAFLALPQVICPSRRR